MNMSKILFLTFGQSCDHMILEGNLVVLRTTLKTATQSGEIYCRREVYGCCNADVKHALNLIAICNHQFTNMMVQSVVAQFVEP